MFGRCCCGIPCNPCGISAPLQMQVDVSGIAETIACTSIPPTCPTFDGSYVLDRVSYTNQPACGWQKRNINTSPACYIRDVYLWAPGFHTSGFFSNPDHWLLVFQFVGEGTSGGARFKWFDTTNPRDCSALSGQSFTYSGQPVNIPCDLSSATASISAL